MRWNSTAVLVGNPNRTQGADGSWVEGEPERTEVFCNRRSAGTQDTSTPDVGLAERAEIEVRISDYSDQPRVELDGKLFDVKDVYVVASGEFARITLDRGIANV